MPLFRWKLDDSLEWQKWNFFQGTKTILQQKPGSGIRNKTGDWKASFLGAYVEEKTLGDNTESQGNIGVRL